MGGIGPFLIAAPWSAAKTDNRDAASARSVSMPESSKPVSSPAHAEELDLAIPDMDSITAEAQVKEILEGLPGIHFVRLMGRGAFIRYNPTGIDKDQICTAIRRSGFRASTFQDSKSGATGLSSQ